MKSSCDHTDHERTETVRPFCKFSMHDQGLRGQVRHSHPNSSNDDDDVELNVNEGWHRGGNHRWWVKEGEEDEAPPTPGEASEAHPEPAAEVHDESEGVHDGEEGQEGAPVEEENDASDEVRKPVFLKDPGRMTVQ